MFQRAAAQPTWGAVGAGRGGGPGESGLALPAGPMTAQGIFHQTSANVLQTSRKKVPVRPSARSAKGRSANEITPGHFIFTHPRVRSRWRWSSSSSSPAPTRKWPRVLDRQTGLDWYNRSRACAGENLRLYQHPAGRSGRTTPKGRLRTNRVTATSFPARSGVSWRASPTGTDYDPDRPRPSTPARTCRTWTRTSGER